MRRGKKKKRGLLGILFLELFLLICPVYGADNSQGQDMLEQEKEKIQLFLPDEIEQAELLVMIFQVYTIIYPHQRE